MKKSSLETTVLIPLVFSLLLPSFVFAAPQNFRELVAVFLEILSGLIYLVFLLIFIVFIWGIVRTWILGSGDPKNIESGKKIIVAGLVAFVVTLGIWGIVAILRFSLFQM